MFDFEHWEQIWLVLYLETLHIYANT